MLYVWTDETYGSAQGHTAQVMISPIDPDDNYENAIVESISVPVRGVLISVTLNTVRNILTTGGASVTMR